MLKLGSIPRSSSAAGGCLPGGVGVILYWARFSGCLDCDARQTVALESEVGKPGGNLHDSLSRACLQASLGRLSRARSVRSPVFAGWVIPCLATRSLLAAAMPLSSLIRSASTCVCLIPVAF